MWCFTQRPSYSLHTVNMCSVPVFVFFFSQGVVKDTSSSPTSWFSHQRRSHEGLRPRGERARNTWRGLIGGNTCTHSSALQTELIGLRRYCGRNKGMYRVSHQGADSHCKKNKKNAVCCCVLWSQRAGGSFKTGSEGKPFGALKTHKM